MVNSALRREVDGYVKHHGIGHVVALCGLLALCACAGTPLKPPRQAVAAPATAAAPSLDVRTPARNEQRSEAERHRETKGPDEAAAGNRHPADDHTARLLPMLAVRKDGHSVGHLLGSVHLLPHHRAPLHPAILAAYEAAQTLVVELNMTPEQGRALSVRTLQQGMYPGGDGLSQHAPAELVQRATEEAARLDLPPAAVERMRPWLLSLTLSMQRTLAEGFSPQQGVDQEFLARAQVEKPILALETAEGQLDLFASLSEAEQLQMLEDTLVRQEDTQEVLHQLLSLWTQGDLQAIGELVYRPLRERPELQPMYEGFYFARNEAMARRMAVLFEDGRQHFVVVGMGHLVGPRSIVDYLRASGFTVEQVAQVEEPGSVPDVHAYPDGPQAAVAGDGQVAAPQSSP